MLNRTLQQRLADDLVRKLASALRGAQLYAEGHPLVGRNISHFADAVSALLEHQPQLTIGLVADEVVVDDAPVPKGSGVLGELHHRLQRRGIQRIGISRGVSADEVALMVRAINAAEFGDDRGLPLRRLPDGGFELPHIHVGRIRIEERLEASVADMATIRRLYSDAVSTADRIWESARANGLTSAEEVRQVVQSLAQAVSQNRTALLSLTALRNYDNYTFTHMVNVSILAMAQARGLGIEGPALREMGMAGLMHDIGKVRTPHHILNKPDRLTDEELVIMRRHVLDGAELLRRIPDMPAIVPVAAFEHHLRADGSGYPEGVERESLNLATQIVAIADVYDAMRSQRAYQQAHPTDRILAVLRDQNAHHFDQHLVRRFVQLLGIYPPGNLVKLNTGGSAVVSRANPGHPYRPKGRVVLDKAARPVDTPYDINLWEVPPSPDRASTVVAPADGAELGIDPLAYM
jgi:putative nucleotidyltransferase with HDIG domain